MTSANVVAYVRKTTLKQDPAPQHDTLTAVGAVRTFTGSASGAMTKRPRLEDCLDFRQPGSVRAVSRIDRLGRCLPRLVDLATQLDPRPVQLRSLTEQIDTTTVDGERVVHILAALAQIEHALISECTKAGPRAACARGRRGRRVGGRPTVMSPQRLRAARTMYAVGATLSQLAAALGVRRATAPPALRRSEL